MAKEIKDVNNIFKFVFLQCIMLCVTTCSMCHLPKNNVSELNSYAFKLLLYKQVNQSCTNPLVKKNELGFLFCKLCWKSKLLLACIFSLLLKTTVNHHYSSHDKTLTGENIVIIQRHKERKKNLFMFTVNLVYSFICLKPTYKSKRDYERSARYGFVI